MAAPGRRWIALDGAGLRAQIDPLGAQLSVLQDAGGRDLLWSGDPAVWAGRAPILFPIVGALAGGQYRLDGQHYPLPRHGFARGSLFATVHSDRSSALLRLTAGAATRAVYPFDFELDVRFELVDATLSVTTVVRNTGAVPLPASHGYHPAFRWPLPYGADRAAHAIDFEQPEGGHIRRLDAHGLLTPRLHATPLEGCRLRLADELFRDDALIFDRVRSRRVRYGAAGGPRIEVNLADAPYLGIWSKPGAHFICIEPWHGLADPQGFSGDFPAKPGVFTVGVGEARSIGMQIRLWEDGGDPRGWAATI